jgi:hypothetical protein
VIERYGDHAATAFKAVLKGAADDKLRPAYFAGVAAMRAGRWGKKPRGRDLAPCINQADRVETLFAAAPALSIRVDVLSRFSEPGNSVCEELFAKELSNAMTLDNVLEFDQLRRSSAAFQAWSADVR